MSRRAKGPRLWLRPKSADRASAWLILDGNRQRGTGCGVAHFEQAQSVLAEYIKEKHSSDVNAVSSRDPSQIEIADVLNLYQQDIIPERTQPVEALARIGRLLRYWGGRRLSYVTGPTCRAYAEQRSTPAAARRELEDLRAAINHHRREGLHDKIVSVVLPPKSKPREHWLERDEAARLIWAAWRYREQQNLRGTDRRTRRHVARFMIFARHMGSRAEVICSASIETKRPPDRPWCDLRRGVFHGLPEGQLATKKRRQRGRIPTPLLAHLRRWRANGQRYVVEWNGEPVQRITKAHDAAVSDARLDPRTTPHTWRHTIATWLMQNGADPFRSADFLAMTLETLTRNYGHHRPDDSADVHESLRQKKRS
jgi:integrase